MAQVNIYQLTKVLIKIITSKFAVGTIKSSKHAIAKLQLKTSVLRGPVSNFIKRMRNIQFTDCDEDSQVTTRLLEDFKDYSKITRFQGFQKDYRDYVY